jgi:hypothetical protein
MDEIEHRFNEQFASWGIQLSPADIEHRTSGKIVQAGWAIWYRFGRDDAGEYLDYYAPPRMTNDRHMRLRESGAAEWLPAIESLRMCSDDPAEDSRLAEEYYARNLEVGQILEEKGFGLHGDEPGAVQINRFLHLQPEPQRELPATGMITAASILLQHGRIREVPSQHSRGNSGMGERCDSTDSSSILRTAASWKEDHPRHPTAGSSRNSEPVPQISSERSHS